MKAIGQFLLKALRFLFIAHLLWWIDQGVGNAAAASTAAHWVGGSGNWSDPSKWDTGVVPNNAGGNTCLVTIDVADADVVVTVNQAITVSGLSNAETVRVEGGGNLLLSGSVTNAGTIAAVEGTLRLSGATVVNTGHAILADHGAMEINGGTIVGGTITGTNVAGLVVTADSVLDGVVLGAELVVPAGGWATTRVLVVRHGLELNSRLTLRRSSDGSGVVVLRFDGEQALVGTGEVVFEDPGSGAYDWRNYVQPSGGALTIGPGMTIRGQRGTVGDGSQPLVNQGTIRSDAGQWITVTGSSVTNQGTIMAVGAGAVAVNSPLRVDGLGRLSSQPSGLITIADSLLGDTRNIDYYSSQGTVRFGGNGTAGSPQVLEVMSRDLGTNAAGFDDNLVYGTLTLANNTYLRLADQSDNSAGGGAEALYVNSLIVPAGTTLDLNGLHLYARAAQIGGTIVGGTIQQIPDSGPIDLAVAAPGAIGTAGELDEWTFFGRAGRAVTVVVNPGGGGFTPPLPPYLGFAEVQLVAATDTVLAKASSGGDGAIVTLANVALSADGNYRVQVRASAGHQANTGNYTITVWDITADVAPLLFNQQFLGRIETPYSVDRWTFSANAAQQVRFDLGKVSGASPAFDLTGPNGWIGFSNLVADSGLVTLSTSGNYVLTAYGTGGQFGGTYTFHVEETAQTDLLPGTPFKGTFAGSSQAQLFRIPLTNSTPLLVTLADSSTGNHSELYLKLGAPPTRGDYEYCFAKPASSDQQVLVQMATPGTWYALVYADYVAAPSDYSLLATAAPILLTEVTPNRHGTNTPAELTLVGAGFDSMTTVQLVATNGAGYSASLVELDSFTQITATFAAGSVPVGRHSVRLVRAGGQASELADAFEMIAGGKARLEANVIFPSRLGYHQLATLYLEYANLGDVAMPAPLLALTPTQKGRAAALLTLDKSRVAQGFWTTAIPEGFANTVQILASGKVPGTLLPGESGCVPVYWAGWQLPWDFSYPPIDFQLITMRITDKTPMEWAKFKPQLRPDTISVEAWDAVFANLTNQVGQTWGDYVAMLDENAANLSRLGQRVTEVEQLWTFQVQQAIGFNPLEILARTIDLVVPAPGLSIGFKCKYRQGLAQRYALGPFGRGWSTAWSMFLRVPSDGAVEIVSPSGSVRRFEPDGRGTGYFAPPGEGSTLRPATGGGFLLQEADGYSMRFLADGKIGHVEDSNGNRITADYASGRLTRLLHSAGQWLSISYNDAGLIQAVSDSLGRTNTCAYDAANEHLISVHDYRGLTTQYVYSSGAGLATEHALVSIAHADGTHRSFAYDANGRLAAVFRDGNAERIDFDYGAAGAVTFTKANGVRRRLFYDRYGSLAKIEGACCGQQSYSFDDLHRVSAMIDAEGRRHSSAYTRDGVLTSRTDPLRHSDRFTYGGSPRRLYSATDARGNTTRYQFDDRGNVTAISYPDQSQRRFTYDAVGNLLSVVNRRGETFAFAYDAAGEVIRETLPDGQLSEFTYESRGNLITASNTLGVIRCEYNAADQMTQVSYPNGRSLTLTYDAAGRRSRMVDHLGFAVNYSYDAVGRLSSLTDGAGALIVRYTYDAAGRLSRKDQGNRTYSEFEYDFADRVIHLVNYAPNGAVNSRFDYFYDDAGQVTAMTTLDGQWAYQHDDAGQLTRAVFISSNPTLPSQDLAYAYDAAGNRSHTVENGVTTEYLVNSRNQYTKIGQTECGYDPEGNLVSRADGPQKVTYSYDCQNRLTRAAGPDGIWEYEYDAFGNRAAVSHDGQRIEYLLDPLGLGNIVSEFSAAGDLIARYAHGLQLVTRLDGAGGATYYDFDANGSTAGLTDGSGGYVNRYVYEPFGRKLSSTNGLANAFEFVGQSGVMDDGNGLTFMRARYYSPTIGRFVAEDPIGAAADDLNLYRYVGNAPLGQKDPSGYQSATTWCWQEDGTWLPMTIYYGNSHLDPCVEAHERMHQLQCQLGDWDETREGCNKEEVEAYQAQLVCAKRVYGKNSAYAKQVKKELDLAKKGKQPSCDKFPPRLKPPPPSCPPGGGKQVVLHMLSGVDWRLRGEANAGRVKPLALATDPIDWPPPGDGDGSDDGDGAGDGSDGGTAPSCDSGTAGIAGPTDPNAKTGPSGFGTGAFVSADSVLPYRINFENKPTATAPAQFVVVADQLDANFDWSTFELREIGFGDQLIVIPDHRQYFETIVPMSYNNRSFEVHIQAGLDAATGKVTARFMSIDPETGLPPEVLTGFLPPENGTGRGQGHVSYVARLKTGVPSGIQLRNVAQIQFDFGEIIATNQRDPHDPSKGTDPSLEALITIDATPPASQVLALAATSPPGGFTVSWSGQDEAGGSGIASYDVYVSDNGGSWTAWQSGVSQTSAVFDGQIGHAYAFYSIATDNVGHRETAPAAPDAQTTVTANSAPILTITASETGVQLSWPASAAGFSPEVTDALSSPIRWQTVTDSPVQQGDRLVLTLDYSEATQFYRLRKP